MKDYCTSYKDLANNIKEVRHTVVMKEGNEKEEEERIFNELCRVFSRKTVKNKGK